MPVPRRDRNSYNQFPDSYRWNYVRYGDCDSGANLLNAVPGSVVDGAIYVTIGGNPTIQQKDDAPGTRGNWEMISTGTLDIGSLSFGNPQAQIDVTDSPLISDFYILHDPSPAQILSISSTDGISRTFGLFWDAANQQWTYTFANGVDPAINGSVPVGIGPAGQYNHIRLEIGELGTRYLINNVIVFSTTNSVDPPNTRKLIPGLSIQHGTGVDAAVNSVVLDYYAIQQALRR